MQTKKDFVAAARTIKARIDGNADKPDAIRACEQIAYDMADEFGRTNPRFKRDVFLKACGLVTLASTGANSFRVVTP
jgi:hypothetical protein